MANYNSTAKVVLTVNGKQAQQMLSSLQKEAQKLERNIEKAAKAGDKATMKKLQRELNSTNNLIKQMQGSAKTAEQVLNRLDKASPKELQKTLKTLQTQLAGIERGSAAWNAQVEKIRRVKEEISAVNRQLAVQQSRWDKMNNWLNNAQTFIMGVAASLTGLVMAGRKAVNVYAELDEQYANTRKYTGMTEDEVAKLNEAFARMDTRTSKAKLNELAQEAGRLGKNTLESVQEYVEAADIINVALVDLGDGATQTIAKLTNIFGIEDLLGTKDAMLAVGSTVNVLSQNCTASKPYLVEFAQRMAGIGAQAGLTIPEILAFGAVLDANGQKVEMSATAIQKVIMNLANKNEEFANTLGLDAEKLNQTLKNNAKDGLLMFLQALHDIGEESSFDNATMILAPAFKDMGLDAARVSQVLSTLAQHIDEVKWQIGEANSAFMEASSATHEFEIFNSTAQAAIDKAKKSVTTLAENLGEKLYPMMKHVYTSSGLFLRILNEIVSLLIEYRRVIIPLVGALTSYYVSIGLAKTAQLAWNVAITVGKSLFSAFTYVIGLGDVAIIAFTKGTKAAGTALTFLNGEMKASPWGIVISAATGVGLAIYNFTQSLKENKQAQEDAKKAAEDYQKSLVNIEDAAAESASKEISRIESLYKAATNEALAKDARRAAAEKLQKLYPDYFKNLSTEEIMVGKAKDKYDELRKSIIDTAKARAAEKKIEENEKELLKLEMEEEVLQDKYNKADKRFSKANNKYEKSNKEEKLRSLTYDNSTDAATGWYINVRKNYNNRAEAAKEKERAMAELEENRRKQKSITDANKKLEVKYKLTVSVKSEEDSRNRIEIKPTTGKGSDNDSGSTNSSKNRFEGEDNWRKEEEAKARIAYSTGQSDFISYTKEMDRIAVEFYAKQLQHSDLSEQERLEITAKYNEAQLKQQKDLTTESLEAEEALHNELMAELRQYYIDGEVSKETYDATVEEYEIAHLQRLISLQKEGSKERLETEKRLQQMLITQMEKRQNETEKAERKIQEYQEKFFRTGDNSQKYKNELAALQEAYQREILAAEDNNERKLEIEKQFLEAKKQLAKEYGIDPTDGLKNKADAVVEWFKSDAGKAVTQTTSTITSQMGAMFTSLNSFVQAELELETAAIKKRYEGELSAAEGNAYKVKQIEKKKEKELAKAKNEANKKMFAMQVIQAVAQTAQNALSAYGSAAAVPLVGHIIAPIAAAMAIAAGAIQIASIKKQQQASEAQGYAIGGFTPEGAVDEPVGVVHAGEWVASQKLVKNPQARPIIDALEYAQRNNRIGSLNAIDVSRAITAPIVLANKTESGAEPKIIVNVPQNNSNSDLQTTLKKLNERLNEPFVTVATVTGDKGINKAQEEFEMLLKNKSPKSRR